MLTNFKYKSPTGTTETRQLSEDLDDKETAASEVQDKVPSFLGVGHDIPSVSDGVEPPLLSFIQDEAPRLPPEPVLQPTISGADLPPLTPLRSTSPQPSSQTGDAAKLVRNPRMSPVSVSDLEKRRLPAMQVLEHTSTIVALSSPTAVPLHFRTPRASFGISRSSPLSSPTVASEASPSFVPRTRQARPGSTEFKSSTEFRPLWLVERHKSRQEFEAEELYPSLPSSQTTSRSSSVHDTEEKGMDRDLVPEFDHDASLSEFGLGINVEHDLNEATFLDSQQPTPVAANFSSVLHHDASPDDKQSRGLNFERNFDKQSDQSDSLTHALSSSPIPSHDRVDERLPQYASMSSSEHTSGDFQKLPPLPSSRPSSPYGEDHGLLPSSFTTEATIAAGAVVGGAIALGLGLERNEDQRPSTSGADDIPTDHNLAAPLDAAENPLEKDEPTMGGKLAHAYEPIERDYTPKDLTSTSQSDKSIAAGDVSSDPTSTSRKVRTPSIELQRQLQEQDAQDAVDTWFAPPVLRTARKDRKDRKGKKKQKSLTIQDLNAPTAQTLDSSSSLKADGDLLTTLESHIEQRQEYTTPEKLSDVRISEDSQNKSTILLSRHGGALDKAIEPTSAREIDEAEDKGSSLIVGPDILESQNKSQLDHTANTSREFPSEDVDEGPKITPTLFENEHTVDLGVTKAFKDLPLTDEPRKLEESDFPPQGDSSVSETPPNRLESEPVSEPALPAKKSKKDKRKAKQTPRTELSLEVAPRQAQSAPEADSSEVLASSSSIATPWKDKEVKEESSTLGSSNLADLPRTVVHTTEPVIPVKKNGKGKKKQRVDLWKDIEPMSRDLEPPGEESRESQPSLESLRESSLGDVDRTGDKDTVQGPLPAVGMKLTQEEVAPFEDAVTFAEQLSMPELKLEADPSLLVKKKKGKRGKKTIQLPPVSPPAPATPSEENGPPQSSHGMQREIVSPITAVPIHEAAETVPTQEVLPKIPSPDMIPLPNDADLKLDSGRPSNGHRPLQQVNVEDIMPISRKEGEGDMRPTDALPTSAFMLSDRPSAYSTEPGLSTSPAPEKFPLPKDENMDVYNDVDNDQPRGYAELESKNFDDRSHEDIMLTSAPTIAKTPDAFSTNSDVPLSPIPEAIPLPEDQNLDLYDDLINAEPEDVELQSKKTDDKPHEDTMFISRPIIAEPAVRSSTDFDLPVSPPPEMIPLPKDEDLDSYNHPINTQSAGDVELQREKTNDKSYKDTMSGSASITAEPLGRSSTNFDLPLSPPPEAIPLPEDETIDLYDASDDDHLVLGCRDTGSNLESHVQRDDTQPQHTRPVAAALAAELPQISSNALNVLRSPTPEEVPLPVDPDTDLHAPSNAHPLPQDVTSHRGNLEGNSFDSPVVYEVSPQHDATLLPTLPSLTSGGLVAAQEERTPKSLSPEKIPLPVDSDLDLQDFHHEDQIRHDFIGGDSNLDPTVSRTEPLNKKQKPHRAARRSTSPDAGSSKSIRAIDNLSRASSHHSMSVSGDAGLESSSSNPIAPLATADSLLLSPEKVPLPEDGDMDPFGNTIAPSLKAVDLAVLSPENVPLPDDVNLESELTESVPLPKEVGIGSSPCELTPPREETDLVSHTPSPNAAFTISATEDAPSRLDQEQPIVASASPTLGSLQLPTPGGKGNKGQLPRDATHMEPTFGTSGDHPDEYSGSTSGEKRQKAIETEDEGRIGPSIPSTERSMQEHQSSRVTPEAREQSIDAGPALSTLDEVPEIETNVSSSLSSKKKKTKKDKKRKSVLQYLETTKGSTDSPHVPEANLQGPFKDTVFESSQSKSISAILGPANEHKFEPSHIPNQIDGHPPESSEVTDTSHPGEDRVREDQNNAFKPFGQMDRLSHSEESTSIQDCGSYSVNPERDVAMTIREPASLENDPNVGGESEFRLKKSKKDKKGKKKGKSDLSAEPDISHAKSLPIDERIVTSPSIAPEGPTTAEDQQPAIAVQKPEPISDNDHGTLSKGGFLENGLVPRSGDPFMHSIPHEKDVLMQSHLSTSDEDLLRDAISLKLPADDLTDFPIEVQNDAEEVARAVDDKESAFSLKKTKNGKKNNRKPRLAMQGYDYATTEVPLASLERSSVVENRPDTISPPTANLDQILITQPSGDIGMPAVANTSLLTPPKLIKGGSNRSPAVEVDAFRQQVPADVATENTTEEHPGGDPARLGYEHSPGTDDDRGSLLLRNSPATHNDKVVAVNRGPVATEQSPPVVKQRPTVFNEEPNTVEQATDATGNDHTAVTYELAETKDSAVAVMEEPRAIRDQALNEPDTSRTEGIDWDNGTRKKVKKGKKGKDRQKKGISPSFLAEESAQPTYDPLNQNEDLPRPDESAQGGKPARESDLDDTAMIADMGPGDMLPHSPKEHGQLGQVTEAPDPMEASRSKSPEKDILRKEMEEKTREQDEWSGDFTTKKKGKKGKKQRVRDSSPFEDVRKGHGAEVPSATADIHPSRVDATEQPLLKDADAPMSSTSAAVPLQESAFESTMDDSLKTSKDDPWSSTTMKKAKKGKKSKKQQASLEWEDETAEGQASLPAEAVSRRSKTPQSETLQDKADNFFGEKAVSERAVEDTVETIPQTPIERIENGSVEGESESFWALNPKRKAKKGKKAKTQSLGPEGFTGPMPSKISVGSPGNADEARAIPESYAKHSQPFEDQHPTEDAVLGDLPALPPSRPDSPIGQPAQRLLPGDQYSEDFPVSEGTKVLPITGPAIRLVKPQTAESPAEVEPDDHSREETVLSDFPDLPLGRPSSPIPNSAEVIPQTQSKNRPSTAEATLRDLPALPPSPLESPSLSSIESVIQHQPRDGNSPDRVELKHAAAFPLNRPLSPIPATAEAPMPRQEEKLSTRSIDIPSQEEGRAESLHQIYGGERSTNEGDSEGLPTQTLPLEEDQRDGHADKSPTALVTSLGLGLGLEETLQRKTTGQILEKGLKRDKKQNAGFDMAEHEEQEAVKPSIVYADQTANPEHDRSGFPPTPVETRMLGTEPSNQVHLRSETPLKLATSMVSAKQRVSTPPQINRDSAVHVSDSPLLPHPLPGYNSARDSGYQDTMASPVLQSKQYSSAGSEVQSPLGDNFERAIFRDISLTTPVPAPETRPQPPGRQAPVGPSQQAHEYVDSTHPLQVSVELDPAYELSVSRHRPGKSGFPIDPNDSVNIQWESPGSPSLPISSEYPVDYSRDLQSAHRSRDDMRQPSPVDSATKDRSSVLFHSSPSTREETLYNLRDHPHDENLEHTTPQKFQKAPDAATEHTARGLGTHETSQPNRDVLSLSPSAAERNSSQAAVIGASETHQGPRLSLFGGPVGTNSDRQSMRSPPPAPLSFVGSERRPLDTITEYSPEESPLHKKNRALSDVGSPERGTKSVCRAATPQSLGHDHRQSAPAQTSGLGSTPHSQATVTDKSPLSTDDFIARLSWPAVDEDNHSVDLDRVLSRNTDRSARARDGDVRSASGQSIGSGGSINRFRTPDREHMRSASGVISRSATSTPPLRRVDRSLSGDLRAANKRSEAKSLAKQPDLGFDPPVASSSTYDPIKDKGKGAVRDMADVYVSHNFL